MDSNLTGISTVNLSDTDKNPYVFTANATANLVINASHKADTITLGAASQTVNGNGGNDRIIASAANAGALINGGSGKIRLRSPAGHSGDERQGHQYQHRAARRRD